MKEVVHVVRIHVCEVQKQEPKSMQLEVRMVVLSSWRVEAMFGGKMGGLRECYNILFLDLDTGCQVYFMCENSSI